MPYVHGVDVTTTSLPSFFAPTARRFAANHSLTARAIWLHVSNTEDAFSTSISTGACLAFEPVELGLRFSLTEVDLCDASCSAFSIVALTGAGATVRGQRDDVHWGGTPPTAPSSASSVRASSTVALTPAAGRRRGGGRGGVSGGRVGRARGGATGVGACVGHPVADAARSGRAEAGGALRRAAGGDADAGGRDREEERKKLKTKNKIKMVRPTL